jgi:predicted metal-dependent HD superfamily phosphohydrolase
MSLSFTQAYPAAPDTFYQTPRPEPSLFQTAPQSEIERNLLEHELVIEALDQLRKHLSREYFYHCLEHTSSVIVNAIRCAVLDGASTRDLELVAIAAAWHDTGFLIQRDHNEPVGASMAIAAMRRHSGYSESEITDVETAILDTQVQPNKELGCMTQTARGRLSAWVLDGDLSNFGHTEFLEVSLLLLREFTGVEIKAAQDLRNPKAIEFLAGSIRMLNAHRFLSRGGQTLFHNQKLRNFELTSRVLANAINGTPESLQKAWEAAHSVL